MEKTALRRNWINWAVHNGSRSRRRRRRRWSRLLLIWSNCTQNARRLLDSNARQTATSSMNWRPAFCTKTHRTKFLRRKPWKKTWNAPCLWTVLFVVMLALEKRKLLYAQHSKLRQMANKSQCLCQPLFLPSNTSKPSPNDWKDFL